MKKSILAISAAAIVGGLGIAGTAQAQSLKAFFSQPTQSAQNTMAPATMMALTPGGIGHHLFTPYYTAQGSMNTLFNIANTDVTNGKAVKVRFRGAANSDDVLDFIVFLSPGDVWTASIKRNATTGLASISTPDNSCTLPPAKDSYGVAKWPVDFNTVRLPDSTFADGGAAGTREGYIEVLNMADIPYYDGDKNLLYKATKHVAGKPSCALPAAFSAETYADVVNDMTFAGATAAGLAAPSGGLMGSWAIFDSTQLAVIGGTQTALVAAVALPPNPTSTPLAGYGNIVYSPQSNMPIQNQAFVLNQTSDPLLRDPVISAAWFDLPDMSTPYLPGLGASPTNPLDQAEQISLALSKSTIYNDYIATTDSTMMTDWVVSQPTRRYLAAVDHTAGTILYPTPGGATSKVRNARSSNPYAGNLTLNDSSTQACLVADFQSLDREEKMVVGGFSPSDIDPKVCGEVFTLKFAPTSVLQASLTNRRVIPAGEAGWARLKLRNGVYLPITGFAATSFKQGNGNYGLTLQHRWDGYSVYQNGR